MKLAKAVIVFSLSLLSIQCFAAADRQVLCGSGLTEFQANVNLNELIRSLPEAATISAPMVVTDFVGGGNKVAMCVSVNNK